MYFLASAGGTNDSTSFFFHIFFDSILFLLVIQPYATNYTKLNYLIWDTVIKEMAHPLSRRLGQKFPLVSRSWKWAMERPQCHLYWGALICVPFLCSNFKRSATASGTEPRGPICRGQQQGTSVGYPVSGEGWENGWKEAGTDLVAKNMNKWSSIPQIE